MLFKQRLFYSDYLVFLACLNLVISLIMCKHVMKEKRNVRALKNKFRFAFNRLSVRVRRSLQYLSTLNIVTLCVLFNIF